MDRVTERAGELTVLDRVGRGGVHRSDHLRGLDDPAHQLNPVETMDPREILPARSRRPPAKKRNGSIIRLSAPPIARARCRF